jgi:hypothetical protein
MRNDGNGLLSRRWRYEVGEGDGLEFRGMRRGIKQLRGLCEAKRRLDEGVSKYDALRTQIRRVERNDDLYSFSNATGFYVG